MKVSIIIPNYNGADLLRKNLPHVHSAAEVYKKSSGAPYEIIVTDDGSTDNSREVVEELKLPVTVLTHKTNTGFSSNVNRGAARAGGEIFVLLNTDVRPDRDFLEPLLKHFTEEKLFAVGSIDKSIESGKTVLRGRGIGDWKRGMLIHRRGELDKNNTLWVSGGSGAFRASMWEKLRGLNEMMDPYYWEDIDLSYRALKAGWQIRVEKESTVTHEHEKGTVRKSASEKSIKTTAYRNQFYFVWTNITDGNILMNHFFWLPYHTMKAAVRLDGAYFLGFFSALLHLLPVIMRRRQVRKLMLLSDKDILSRFPS